jgi:hypothetical protein
MKRNNPHSLEADSIFPKVYDPKKAFLSRSLITPDNIAYIEQRSNSAFTIKTKKAPSAQHVHPIPAIHVHPIPTIRKSAFTKPVKFFGKQPANASANRQRHLLQHPQSNHTKPLCITTYFLPISQRNNAGNNPSPMSYQWRRIKSSTIPLSTFKKIHSTTSNTPTLLEIKFLIETMKRHGDSL